MFTYRHMLKPYIWVRVCISWFCCIEQQQQKAYPKLRDIKQHLCISWWFLAWLFGLGSPWWFFWWSVCIQLADQLEAGIPVSLMCLAFGWVMGVTEQSSTLAWASVHGNWLLNSCKRQGKPQHANAFQTFGYTTFANVSPDRESIITESSFLILHLLGGGVTMHE